MIIPTEFPYSEDPSRDAERIVFNKLKVVFGNEKNFDIYLDLSSKKLSIAGFKKFDSHNIFFTIYD